MLDWPLAAGERGREVRYGLVGPADGSVAFRFLYTLVSTAGGRREGRLWAALTDRDRWQRAAYCAPDDSLRYDAHCSVSTVTLRCRADGERRALRADAGRAEWMSVEPPVPGEYRPAWE